MTTQTPTLAVEAAPAVSVGPTQVEYPSGGWCAVCGFPAARLVILATSRQVWHTPARRGGPCILPNPPKRGTS